MAVLFLLSLAARPFNPMSYLTKRRRDHFRITRQSQFTKLRIFRDPLPVLHAHPFEARVAKRKRRRRMRRCDHLDLAPVVGEGIEGVVPSDDDDVRPAPVAVRPYDLIHPLPTPLHRGTHVAFGDAIDTVLWHAEIPRVGNETLLARDTRHAGVPPGEKFVFVR